MHKGRHIYKQVATDEQLFDEMAREFNQCMDPR